MRHETVVFHIQYTVDEDGYMALEPVTGTSSWGETLPEARRMITEALELYFEEVGSEQALAVADEHCAMWTSDVHVGVKV